MSYIVKFGRICLPPNTVIKLFFSAPNVNALIATSSLIAGEYPQTVAGLRIVKSIFFFVTQKYTLTYHFGFIVFRNRL